MCTLLLLVVEWKRETDNMITDKKSYFNIVKLNAVKSTFMQCKSYGIQTEGGNYVAISDFTYIK
jgi:hypothetical protein